MLGTYRNIAWDNTKGKEELVFAYDKEKRASRTRPSCWTRSIKQFASCAESDRFASGRADSVELKTDDETTHMKKSPKFAILHYFLFLREAAHALVDA